MTSNLTLCVTRATMITAYVKVNIRSTPCREASWSLDWHCITLLKYSQASSGFAMIRTDSLPAHRFWSKAKVTNVGIRTNVIGSPGYSTCGLFFHVWTRSVFPMKPLFHDKNSQIKALITITIPCGHAKKCLGEKVSKLSKQWRVVVVREFKLMASGWCRL